MWHLPLKSSIQHFLFNRQRAHILFASFSIVWLSSEHYSPLLLLFIFYFFISRDGSFCGLSLSSAIVLKTWFWTHVDCGGHAWPSRNIDRSNPLYQSILPAFFFKKKEAEKSKVEKHNDLYSYWSVYIGWKALIFSTTRLQVLSQCTLQKIMASLYILGKGLYICKILK